MKKPSKKIFVVTPFLVFFSLFISLCCVAQETYTMKKGVIYIVRHAEKDTGNDPRLSSQGYVRSGELANVFKNGGYKLDHIYINRFRRIQLTADSVRLKLHIDTAQYVADNTGDGLITALKRNRNKDKRILIIGHSNTIPVILRRLGISDFPVGDIPDNEYDNLFTVTYHKGKAFLFKSKYGRPSSRNSILSGMNR